MILARSSPCWRPPNVHSDLRRYSSRVGGHRRRRRSPQVGCSALRNLLDGLRGTIYRSTEGGVFFASRPTTGMVELPKRRCGLDGRGWSSGERSARGLRAPRGPRRCRARAGSLNRAEGAVLEREIREIASRYGSPSSDELYGAYVQRGCLRHGLRCLYIHQGQAELHLSVRQPRVRRVYRANAAASGRQVRQRRQRGSGGAFDVLDYLREDPATRAS